MNPCFAPRLVIEKMADARRIAFFGGSFDPPHRGHLAVARAARAALSLDQVLFAPVAAQPLKPRGATAPFADRLAMTRLAIAAEPAFVISLADSPSDNPDHVPNYTFDTLLRLRASLPPAVTLFCLMGADSFLNLRRWHRGAEIPFVAPLIVASRPGQSLQDLAAILPPGLAVASELAPANTPESPDLRTCTLRNPSGASVPFYLLPGLHVDISASQFRAEMRGHGRAARDLLPPAVSNYIVAHNLYR